MTFYSSKDDSSGVCTISAASEGNAPLLEQHAESVGSNVHSNLVGNCCRMTPKEGGYEVEQVFSFDLAGWLPSFVQTL